MKKNNRKGGAIARLIIWSVVFVLLTSVLLLGLQGIATPKGFPFFSFSDQFSYKDQGYTIGNGAVSSAITDIEIHWISGKVTAKPYEGQEVRFEEAEGLSEKEQLRWKVENQRLIIYPRASFWFIGFRNMPKKELTLLLPQGMIPEEIEISTVSGEVDLQGFSCPDMTIDTVSGGIECLGCDFAALECETVSGGLAFNGSLQRLDWSTVSGDAEITDAMMPTELESNSVSGDFTIAMIDGSGFTAEFDSVSGKFHSDFPLEIAGDIRRYSDGFGKYQFDSVSGNVTLKIH